VIDLPALDAEYPIDRSQSQALARDGHLVLRGLVSRDEIAAYRPPLVGAAVREYARLGPEERQLYMMKNLWEHDDGARRFVLARRFARVAAELLAVDAVRLWRDVAFLKEPGEAATPWHQDRHWEPIDTTQFLGIWIALHDTPPEMSTLTFASGSHLNQRMELIDHEGRSQAAMTTQIASRFPLVSYAPLAAGDATVHLGWTLHGSPANTSALRREAFSIFYFADGAHVARWPDDGDPIWTRVQRHHVALRFPGRAPGDPGESPHCPIVYRRSSSG
jgi:hypothetical protein